MLVPVSPNIAEYETIDEVNFNGAPIDQES